MHNYKAVFVDIDNTLLDFDAYVEMALRTGFEKFGLGIFEDRMLPEVLRINGGLWRQIELGEITFPELEAVRFNKIFREFGIDFDGPTFEKYFREYLNESAIPIDGAEELLKFLKNRFIVCAASNGPHAQQLRRIHLAGWDEYFDYVFVSADIGNDKPSKEFFEECLRRMNAGEEARSTEAEATGKPDCFDSCIKPEDILMIGDSLTSDIGGGIAFGMHTCWFNRFGKTTDVKPDMVVEKLSDIVGILEGQS